MSQCPVPAVPADPPPFVISPDFLQPDGLPEVWQLIANQVKGTP